MSTKLQKAKVDGDQPIHFDVSSHGPHKCKQKIAPFYGLDLFVRATFGDSLMQDHNLKMMLTYSHMSIMQALQQPSYQLHYQRPILVLGGHLPFSWVVAFRSVVT
jgi:hypothetical protein